MKAAIFPKIAHRNVRATEALPESFGNFFIEKLDEIDEKVPMENFGDISKAVFENKSEILGQFIKEFVERKFGHLLDQESCRCPKCDNLLKSSIKRPKTVQTLAGSVELIRPYFYCRNCCLGYYPLDEALGLAESSKQYDVQEIEAWLSSETCYQTASEAYERITGDKLSEGHMFDITNAIGNSLETLDVFPTRDQIRKQVETIAENKSWSPIIMIAIDGAHGPMRPEPSPWFRQEKRGKTEWKEVKGFRIYLIDKKRIIHLISWHQVCEDQQLGETLQRIKEAGLIPEEKVRIGIIGDGAAWIWNRCKEIFPSAKEILDYFHCSEYVHGVANAHYGKGTKEAREWCEATLTRIYYGYNSDVLCGLKNLKPQTEEVREKIDKFYTYLSNHGHKMDYGSAKRGGYHIGSGAIESANKFISHMRLKRSGASWYIDNANNMLKIRCAKFNGTFNTIMEKYRKKDQKKIKNKKNTPKLQVVK